MSIVAPKGRKHLSADALFRLVQTGFDTIPNHRLANTAIALPDARMSAFAMFSLQSPSLLAFDKARAEGHWATIYGIARVPCETQMRERLDRRSPAALRPRLQSVFRQCQRGKALEPMALLVHRFRFLTDVPLHASNAARRVTGIEYWDMGADRIQHVSWVTDLRVSPRNVYHLMRGGRARWKMENEPCHTLKNQGDNVEHTYGHGTQQLSVVCAVVMLLAFLVDPTQQLCGALCRAVWTKMGSKRLVWERMRALCEALFYGWEKPRPRLRMDTS